MLKAILINPLILWLQWLSQKILLEFKNSHLTLGYMCRIKNCNFGKYNAVYEATALTNVTLGDFTYVSSGCRVNNTTVGKFSCIGPDVLCGLGKHPSRDFVSMHPVFYSLLAQSGITFSSEEAFAEFKDIAIGHDVWIGARAIILDGIVIGNGAIIGAGAVVTSNVPPYAVVAGVPARVLRYRFESRQVDTLESSKWWDWDENFLRNNYLSFQNIENWQQLCEKNKTRMQ